MINKYTMTAKPMKTLELYVLSNDHVFNKYQLCNAILLLFMISIVRSHFCSVWLLSWIKTHLFIQFLSEEFFGILVLLNLILRKLGLYNQ